MTARSYTVRGTTAEAVLDFYQANLGGWVPLEPPRQDNQTWRGLWERGGRGLQVSAVPAPTTTEDDPQVQLSLQLGPPERLRGFFTSTTTG